MPQSIPPGLTREHVLKAISDLDKGIEHPFGQPTKYELVHDGKRYPPKAVVGLAFKHLAGQILGPEEFSGGEAPGQANYVLRRLGFTVSEISHEEVEKPVPKDWSKEEVRLIVTDYFEMLELELLGKSFSKADHRKSLIPRLDGRSNPSVEYKHSNISAVLTNLGLPYIEGYKPRGNYQALLGQEVETFLDQRPGFLEHLANAPVLNPDKAPETSLDLEKIIESPPESMTAMNDAGKPWLSRKGRRIDFAERDAANRHLAKLGEEFVVKVEQHRLRGLGREDLAAKVEWVAQTIGDGLGFDVRSFDDSDDSEKLVEVKTTGNGKFFPFYVTRNEVRCSEDMTEKFHLFRVFDFARTARIYILPGSLRETCRLEPIQFRAIVHENVES